MDLFEIFGFFILLKESINLIPKTWKFLAPITLLSLIIPSIFILLFHNFLLFIARSLVNQPAYRFMYVSLFIVVEIVLLLLLFKFIDLLVIAIIKISATSYIGENISLSDLYSTVKRILSYPTNKCLSGSRKPGVCFVFLAGSFYTLVVMKIMTRAIACAHVLLFVVLVAYVIYSSVPLALGFVVAVMEEQNDEGKNALDRAIELIDGQRHHGFLMNLFNRLIFVSGLMGFWMMIGDQRALNLKIYGLFVVNVYSLLRIFGSTMWTMLYFRCKKHRGEEVAVLGDGDCSNAKLLV